LIMACEAEKAARDAAQTALDRANSDWWEGALNVAGSGLSTIGAGIGTGVAAVAEVPSGGTSTPLVIAGATATLGGAAWFASALIGMSQADDDYDSAEAAFDAAEAAYCACLGL
jgi:hypothetical protein